MVGDVEVAAPPSLHRPDRVQFLTRYLFRLQQLGDKIDLIDRRVQRTETMQDLGISQASNIARTAKNSPVKNSVAHTAMLDNVTESMVPSLGYLRGNEFLQTEVDKHLAELEKLNKTAT